MYVNGMPQYHWRHQPRCGQSDRMAFASAKNNGSIETKCGRYSIKSNRQQIQRLSAKRTAAAESRIAVAWRKRIGSIVSIFIISSTIAARRVPATEASAAVQPP